MIFNEILLLVDCSELLSEVLVKESEKVLLLVSVDSDDSELKKLLLPLDSFSDGLCEDDTLLVTDFDPEILVEGLGDEILELLCELDGIKFDFDLEWLGVGETLLSIGRNGPIPDTVTHELSEIPSLQTQVPNKHTEISVSQVSSHVSGYLKRLLSKFDSGKICSGLISISKLQFFVPSIFVTSTHWQSNVLP